MLLIALLKIWIIVAGFLLAAILVHATPRAGESPFILLLGVLTIALVCLLWPAMPWIIGWDECRAVFWDFFDE